MKYFKIILKKIFYKKSRIILCAVNFAIGMFLMMLFLTVGINTEEYKLQQSENNLFNKQIYISDFRIDDEEINQYMASLSDNANIAGLQVYTESEAYIYTIDGNEPLNYSLKITTISENYDFLPDYAEMLAGRPLAGQKEILVSNILMENCGYAPKDALGKIIEVNFNNQTLEYTVVGVYTCDDKNLDGAIAMMYDIGDAPISAIKIQTVDVAAVENVSKSINKEIYCQQTNHLSYIKTQALIGRFATIICAVIGGLLLIACTSILKTSLQVSTNDNLTFVSILKAQGFNNKRAGAIFWAELLIIYASALLGSILLYSATIYILPKFVDLHLFGLTNDILSLNFFAVCLVALFALLLALIISIKPLRTIKESDIVLIMHNKD